MNPIADATNRRMQAFLAVMITIGFFVVIAGLMMIRDIPSTVKDILLVMLGALLAAFKEVTGYFFGSSAGSAKKDDTNASLAASISTQGAPDRAAVNVSPEQVVTVTTPPTQPPMPATARMPPSSFPPASAV